MVMLSRLSGPLWRVVTLAFVLFLGMTIWTMWYGMNSDKDDISPILTQLIPAGHCTCQTSTVFECSTCLASHMPASNHTLSPSWEYRYGRDDRNEGLEEDQCNAAFAGLFEDIRRVSKYWSHKGKITTKWLDKTNLVPGLTRALIYNGNLYIIASKSQGEDHRRKMLAILSSIHRALVAYPARQELPDSEFIFSVEDKAEDVVNPGSPVWALARKPTEEYLWLMPDFGFWAWDNIMGDEHNEIGPYDEVTARAVAVENDLPFSKKQHKLVWRGKLSFAPKLRRGLLDKARGHEWNDVKEIDWNIRQNFITLEDHCKYQFIAHVEGRSYSASLKYRQACHSVMVIHELQYIQHHHYLLVSSGPHQNYVEVKRDFSDLAEKMQYLLEHPAEAERIADNTVKTFRERYLTPAAEACYWRALWRGYSEVSEPAALWKEDGQGTKSKRGLRYETFVLLSSSEMMDFQAT